jgi:hypothetical protein
MVTAEERAALSPESASADVPKEIKDWASEVYDVVKAHADAIPSMKDDIFKTFGTRPVKELSAADKKKLYILEKLKEEWELVPKLSTGPGLVVYQHPARETDIPTTRVNDWMNRCGIEDIQQLENILTIFQQEGLIEGFNVIDESR